MKQRVFMGRAFTVALVLGIGIGSWSSNRNTVVQAAEVLAPRFEVDPLWPKPLPNHWLMGHPNGVTVDPQDNIWVVHEGTLSSLLSEATTTPQIAECCVPAPPVLEFDPQGNLVQSWGGPGKGYDWPNVPHGIFVDYQSNVWIGSHGKGPGGPYDGFDDEDNMVLKFTNDGKFLMQIGKPRSSKGNLDTSNLRMPAKIFVDPRTNEAYIADGYGNRRVIVYDANTGQFKRMWGAYGHTPDDNDKGPFGPEGPPKKKGFSNEARDRTYNPNAPPSQQFGNPVHCADLSVDNLVYVCDRPNDRIQVFKPDGTFLKEAFIEKNTLGGGSVFDIAFSRDPQQKFLYVADGENDVIHILDRQSLEELTRFGSGGRQPGQFLGPHSLASDSKGNLYTVDAFEYRFQKFTYKGLVPVTKKDQGAVWPKTTN